MLPATHRACISRPGRASGLLARHDCRVAPLRWTVTCRAEDGDGGALGASSGGSSADSGGEAGATGRVRSYHELLNIYKSMNPVPSKKKKDAGGAKQQKQSTKGGNANGGGGAGSKATSSRAGPASRGQEQQQQRRGGGDGDSGGNSDAGRGSKASRGAAAAGDRTARQPKAAAVAGKADGAPSPELARLASPQAASPRGFGTPSSSSGGSGADGAGKRGDARAALAAAAAAGFKGFGAPGAAAGAAAAGAANPKSLRIFRFSMDGGKLRAAVTAAGMDGRVVVVDQLAMADVLVSVKLTPNGTPVRLLQGYRTAQNAKVPFIVVGRKLTPDCLKKTLGPLAEAKRRGEKLGVSRGNFDPSDRTAGLSGADAKGADIAAAWRAGAARGWNAATAAAAAAAAAAGGGGGGR